MKGAADWGLLQGLKGQDPWETIRAEKNREVQLVALQNNLLSQNLQQQQAAGESVQEYLNTISQIKALEPDMQRVKAKEQALAMNIQEGIKKADGNVKKYILSGGMNELKKYQRNLLDSEEVNTALSNAFNHNRYVADTQAGLNTRGVTWQDASGKQIQGDYATQFNDYLQGNVKNLSYRGGYKRPTGDPRKHFSELYGSQDRYAPVSANPKDVFDYWFNTAKQEGLNDQDAAEYARQEGMMYQNQVQGGERPYMYKWDDPMKKQLMQAQIGKLRAGDQQGGNDNWLFNFAMNHPAITPTEDKVYDNGVGIAKYNIGFNRAKTLTNMQGYGLGDKGQIENRDAAIKQNNLFVGGNEKLDISGLSPEMIRNFTPTGKIVKTYDPKTKQYFDGVEYSITINEPGLERAKYKNGKIEGIFGATEVPGATKDYATGNPFSSDDHSMTLTVVQPLAYNGQYTPQDFIDYTNIAKEQFGTAGGRSVPFGFQAAGMLQDFGDMDALLNE